MIFEGTLRLDSVRNTARDTKTFVFSLKEFHPLVPTEKIDSFSFAAGQFLSLQFTDTAWRAYSIASPPAEAKIEFVVRYVEGGTASRIWWEAKIGDTFPFKGPFGNFLLSENPDAQLVFCGTGTGVAPLRSMILTENEKENSRPMTLLYGGRDKEDIAYLDEIPTWSSSLSVSLGFSRRIPPPDSFPNAVHIDHGRITKFIEERDWNKKSEFYICGNGDMVQSVVTMLGQKDIPKENIFFERFN
ncbi:FAD-dependent oxidoreductase [Candidatus Gracilibacteria bacterium]|nr:FAD-dependent oxidoreductase [Candidatus Gracilibacteria bacterium]